jgi:adenosylcobinamide-phosphate synthase
VALRSGEIGQARQLLYQWRGIDAGRLSSGEVARLAIEEALVASHRHVFAPLILFALLGPAGAVFYRLARHFAQVWQDRTGSADDPFGEFSRRAFAVIDWLPVRMTAASFAIVGNFEDAVFCWRTQATRQRGQAWRSPGTGCGRGCRCRFHAKCRGAGVANAGDGIVAADSAGNCQLGRLISLTGVENG